ncbi:hypothetical protein [Methylobacter sp.]|uniref:hypothetical protein n=1 Tax=Methylobacter sp. TaxID=2051955 RepID=UPI00121A2604|nr:hypothetical protein [Methylobacter sp.]TAK59556.1 MAG: hypothetical protein EPO18_20555 [Methylobacter sp.]
MSYKDNVAFAAASGFGLKVVKARLAGADRILTQTLMKSKSEAEKERARRVRQAVQKALAELEA